MTGITLASQKVLAILHNLSGKEQLKSVAGESFAVSFIPLIQESQLNKKIAPGFPNPAMENWYIVCQYLPAGNVMAPGEFEENVGRQVSGTPSVGIVGSGGGGQAPSYIPTSAVQGSGAEKDKDNKVLAMLSLVAAMAPEILRAVV